MNTITTKDGIYYKDWGTGPVVTFSHGWPLNADAWGFADAVPRRTLSSSRYESFSPRFSNSAMLVVSLSAGDIACGCRLPTEREYR